MLLVIYGMLADVYDLGMKFMAEAIEFWLVLLFKFGTRSFVVNVKLYWGLCGIN